MDPTLARTSHAPRMPQPRQAALVVGRALGGLRSAIAQITAVWLRSPQRDASPDWFRFPLP